jgi:hypothetical protein
VKIFWVAAIAALLLNCHAVKRASAQESLTTAGCTSGHVPGCDAPTEKQRALELLRALRARPQESGEKNTHTQQKRDGIADPSPWPPMADPFDLKELRMQAEARGYRPVLAGRAARRRAAGHSSRPARTERPPLAAIHERKVPSAARGAPSKTLLAQRPRSASRGDPPEPAPGFNPGWKLYTRQNTPSDTRRRQPKETSNGRTKKGKLS